MPNMDGFKLLREIKLNPAKKDMPVIIVTTQTEKECVVNGLKTGGFNYIIKPFTPEVIKDKINEVMD